MKDYLVQHIPLGQIDKNPLNPQTRGEEGDIRNLLKSITESGLYYPILVNQQENGRFMIVEGHRRYAVFEVRKDRNPDFAAIPALVINVGDEYTAKIFREINETSKKLTGKQWVEVFALGGKADDLPSRLAPAIKSLSQLFNANELLKVSQRQGPSVYGLARRVANFCQLNPDDDVAMRQIIAWLINSGDSVNVRVAMQEGQVAKVTKALNEKIKINGNPYPDGEVIGSELPELHLAAADD